MTGSKLINCSIVYSVDTVTPAISGVISESMIVGLKMIANDPLARNSKTNMYVGCHISNHLAQSKDISAFLWNSEMDNIVNSYFKIDIVAIDAKNIGGIACYVSDLTVTNSTSFISIS